MVVRIRSTILAGVTCMLLAWLAFATQIQAADASGPSGELYFLEPTPYYNAPQDVQAAGQIPQHEMPEPVLEQQGQWFKIHYEKRDVWVKQSDKLYVRVLPVKTGEDQTPNRKYMFLHHPLSVYQQPDARSKRLMYIHPQRIQVLKQNGGWYQIRTDAGPGWLYASADYVTEVIGVRKINVTSPVQLYPYPDTFWKPIGTLDNVPYETIAYANAGRWYKIEQNGRFVWLHAKDGQVQPAKASYPARKTEANGYVGNTIFMTEAKHTKVGDLFKRMVVEWHGKPHWLFDTFIIRPVGKEQRGYSFETFDTTKGNPSETLTKYVEEIFAPGKEVDLLEKATLKARAYMEDSTYRTNVIIGLPNPIGTVHPVQRTALVEGYMDRIIAQWNAKNPQALRLVGFYWTNEIVPDSDREFVKEIGTIVRKKGYKFYWAPYFQAAGAEQWRTLGFDFAWMQPNHYFSKDNFTGMDMLGETNTIARQTGAGTMLEWNWKLLEDPKYVRALNEYLDLGRLVGAEHPSVFVYDGEGAIDAFFHDGNSQKLGYVKEKLLAYLLSPSQEE
ncbi:DUF4855 domain-containing protein [Aneurinibacillus thermoaerophilus]|nr:DUF4855 domain-containing protein [Aneurinibacillus thermoaerophilus]MED0677576.1 DUF4855 domain-containing protein [Aneurinibacillus thermoaerophilus]MED0758594.1 DUF4855 domain-containing protein [Aneurinibacillus thermoaerophilus]MED0762362.1 DUF4855 domain-containing protein [Aneurinibacillus thermoaerophilus]MED0762758.1 DUF4855 domain-containing protein [Aneurinibacillus thermoaerophilus]